MCGTLGKSSFGRKSSVAGTHTQPETQPLAVRYSQSHISGLLGRLLGLVFPQRSTKSAAWWSHLLTEVFKTHHTAESPAVDSRVAWCCLQHPAHLTPLWPCCSHFLDGLWRRVTLPARGREGGQLFEAQSLIEAPGRSGVSLWPCSLEEVASSPCASL